MSEKINDFCESLRVQLTKVEDHLTRVGESIKAAPQQAADAVRSSIAEAKATHEQNVRKVDDAKVKLDERLQAKKQEVESQIEAWKTHREFDKLEKRADNAEGCAVAAIELAAACVVEADLATLEAIAARMEAEDAKAEASRDS